MNNIIEALKAHLVENKEKFVQVDEFGLGDEKYEEISFSMDDLLKEIDNFTESFVDK
jgi:hypothetical protein